MLSLISPLAAKFDISPSADRLLKDAEWCEAPPVSMNPSIICTPRHQNPVFHLPPIAFSRMRSGAEHHITVLMHPSIICALATQIRYFVFRQSPSQGCGVVRSTTCVDASIHYLRPSPLKFGISPSADRCSVSCAGRGVVPGSSICPASAPAFGEMLSTIWTTDEGGREAPCTTIFFLLPITVAGEGIRLGHTSTSSTLLHIAMSKIRYSFFRRSLSRPRISVEVWAVASSLVIYTILGALFYRPGLICSLTAALRKMPSMFWICDEGAKHRASVLVWRDTPVQHHPFFRRSLSQVNIQCKSRAQLHMPGSKIQYHFFRRSLSRLRKEGSCYQSPRTWPTFSADRVRSGAQHHAADVTTARIQSPSRATDFMSLRSNIAG
ncbi:hypothetical protein D9615_008451 [Tricholomella constricta]|uniref:Uncharacterized protein n=1 Tax=Tricholomella constricta TaxID=117010 RepID=A0A8H5M0L3_9AGAR|nr:hypothetical protein D9615_008451 [Tricholomella constricta]